MINLWKVKILKLDWEKNYSNGYTTKWTEMANSLLQNSINIFLSYTWYYPSKERTDKDDAAQFIFA